jgi:hypothetical protein
MFDIAADDPLTSFPYQDRRAAFESLPLRGEQRR